MTAQTADTPHVLLARNSFYTIVVFEVMNLSDPQKTRSVRTGRGAADPRLEAEDPAEAGRVWIELHRRLLAFNNHVGLFQFPNAMGVKPGAQSGIWRS
jgi:hypothetical protein